jgi:heme exporter protein A
MIETNRLAKAFGYKLVLRGVDLAVGPGELVALVGPNGAGKTTLLRILATLSRPTGGVVRIAGHTLPGQAHLARRQLGVVLHQTLLYDNLTAEENLRFYGQMYGVPDLPARAAQALERVGLAARRRDQVRTFSRGMQQRLALARALLHGPRVLLLDEPYTGLDPDGAAVLDGLLRGLAAQGCALLVSIHDLPRALALSDRIAVLARGKIAEMIDSRSLTADQFAVRYADLTAVRVQASPATARGQAGGRQRATGGVSQDSRRVE